MFPATMTIAGFDPDLEGALEGERRCQEEHIERGFRIVSGGTDNQFFLLDLIGHALTGKEVDAALGRANITVNKNAVPNDPGPAQATVGRVRAGVLELCRCFPVYGA